MEKTYFPNIIDYPTNGILPFYSHDE